MKTTVSGKVTHNRDAPFWTVPERIEDANVRLCSAEALPVSHPPFEDFTNLTVTDRHLFDAVDLK